MKKYSTPKKDGFITEYLDGTRLFGTWKSRLLQYKKLIKQCKDKT
jgi:hypothetical protein